jgi:hypothetical protein
MTQAYDAYDRRNPFLDSAQTTSKPIRVYRWLVRRPHKSKQSVLCSYTCSYVASMIYPAFLAVSAILYLAALARALPASHKYDFHVTTASQEYPERLPRHTYFQVTTSPLPSHDSHRTVAIRIKVLYETCSFLLFSIFLNAVIPPALYQEIEHLRAFEVNLLFDQNGVPPAAYRHPNSERICHPYSPGLDPVHLFFADAPSIMNQVSTRVILVARSCD